jgi:hypothetical protein
MLGKSRKFAILSSNIKKLQGSMAARRGVDSIEKQWKNPVGTNKNTNKWQHPGGVTHDFWAPVTG